MKEYIVFGDAISFSFLSQKSRIAILNVYTIKLVDAVVDKFGMDCVTVSAIQEAIQETIYEDPEETL